VPGLLVPLLALMDGSRDLATLKTGFELRTGTPVTTASLERLVSALDQAFLLDNKRFAQANARALNEFRSASFRKPILAGSSYPTDADEARSYISRWFNDAQHNALAEATGLQGVVSPHIDFPRGGPTYADVWQCAAGAVREADLFVILGTDHAAGNAEITLTRQAYATPWGAIPTDQGVVDRLAAEAGDEVFDLELHHRGEHSIETAAVWLHYLREGEPFSMIPILCGSFAPFMDGTSPGSNSRIEAMVNVLRSVASQRRTLFVAAADLAHVGPAFGDHFPLDVVAKSALAEKDKEMLQVMSTGTAEGFWNHIRDEGDRRRICGLPPIYLMLAIMTQAAGHLTGYAQCPADQDGGSVVSICGMVYESD